MNEFPYILSDDSITIITNDESKTVLSSNVNFNGIVDAIAEKRWDDALELVDVATAVAKYITDEVEVRDGQVYYNGEAQGGYVVDKILQFMSTGLDPKPLVNFMKKLMLNPSRSCVEQLFQFLENKNMPLDPDGDFYAYKAIQQDWTDKWSKTIPNNIGALVCVPRNYVDDNPDNACSHGLHVGSIEYVSNFRGGNDRVVIVKVNPKDAVSVPCNETTKMRVCAYEVVGEYTATLPDTTYEGFDRPADDLDCDDDYCHDCGYHVDDCDCSPW